MNLKLLEMERARKQLRAYCDQRNRGIRYSSRWSVQETDQCFLIARSGRFDSRGRALPEQVMLKLCYREAMWQLFLPQARGGWLPYPPKPEVEHLDQVIEELDQAPLHVHW